MEDKTCRACGREKPIGEFYRSPAYRDGRVPKCKSCTREYDKSLMSKHRVAPATGLKRCCRCQKQKTLDQFHSRSRNSDGLRSECIGCTREQEHKYRNRNPEQEKFARLRWKYGLSEDDYLAMIADHDGKCAICDGDDEELCVDHCHATGTIRGLLCQKCNAGLGMFGDKTQFLLSAIKYLEKFREPVVPAAPT
jgi:hypothetical protein